MAIRYHFDLYPRTDPKNGVRLVRFTKLQSAEYRGEANGTGAGKLSLRGDTTDAGFIDPLGLQYVRVVQMDDSVVDVTTLSGFDEEVVGGFFLENGDFQALTEAQTRLLTFAGLGVLSYLQRAVAAHQTYIAGAEGPYDDTWHWFHSTPGAILERMIAEAKDPDRPQSPIPAVTATFSVTLDSAGATWTTYGDFWDFVIPVGENLMTSLKRLLEHGLYVWMDPDSWELHAWNAVGHFRDMTAIAWASNKIRFQKPTDGTIATGNIKSDAKRGIAAFTKRSDLLIGGEGFYTWNNASGDIIWEGYFKADDSAGTSHPLIATQQDAARADAADIIRLRGVLGKVPASGSYLPFSFVQLGDRVTVHTGTGQFDLNEDTFPVAAMTLLLRPGGDWDVLYDLGSAYTSMAERAFQARDVAAHNHPPNPALCPFDAGFIVSGSGWKVFSLGSEPDGWKLSGFDDSAWEDTATMAELNISGLQGMKPDRAYVPSESLLYRREYWIDEAELAGADVVFKYAIDNDGTIYVNGTQVANLTGTLQSNYETDHATTLPRSTFRAGFNCIAVSTTDDGASATGAAVYLEITANNGNGTSRFAARCDKHYHAGDIDENNYGDVQRAINALLPGGGSSLDWFVVTHPAYGATGDGSTDDTAEINLAIAALNSAGGGVLYFPHGEYLISTALTTITVPCVVMGDAAGGMPYAVGHGSAILQSSDTANGLTFSDDGWVVRDLAILNTEGAPTAGAGIASATASFAKMSGLTVSGFYDNIDLSEGAGWSLTDSFLHSPVRYGLRIRGTVSPDNGDQSISGCYFMARDHNATAAIRQESAGGLKIVNCKVNNGSALGGKFVDGISFSLASSAVSTSILMVANTSIENVSGDGIDIETLTTGRFYGIHIVGCQVGLFDSNDTGRALKISAATLGAVVDGSISSVVVTGCTFRTDGTAREAVELTRIQGVTFGAIELLGFNGLYVESGSASITVLGVGVTDHGALTGLADDDHTAYLNAARHTATDHSTLVKAAGRWEPVTNGVDIFVWDGAEIVVHFVET